MYVAFDGEGNRLYADDEARYTKCFCPACGEPVTHRKGTIKRPHFAHKKNSDCFMGLNKDYMSEWHIRMQSYFQKEEREVRFQDLDSGDVHIADVFIKDSNTVIEFQHSPISEEEYLSRTIFHLKNGRRIVWIFDESREQEKPGSIGRFKHDDLYFPASWRLNGSYVGLLYIERCYKWIYNPRKILVKGPALAKYNQSYSICVYAGDEETTVHRIINEDCGFEYVVFSINDISMAQGMDSNVFFASERSYLSRSPWKEMIQKRDLEVIRKRVIFRQEMIERQELIRKNNRRAQGLNDDLSKCPICGAPLEIKTAKVGRHKGIKFYGCTNYPRCTFKEE